MKVTETEERFYKAFDIKVIGCYKSPKDYCTYDNDKYNNCKAQGLECPKGKLTYPPITDHVLLELICVYIEWEGFYEATSVEDLKQQILEGLVCAKNNVYDYEYITKEEINELYRKVRKIMGVE